MALTEILVSIVLIGLVVTTVMGAMRTTTAASSLDRDHAIAYSWLQAASDEIYREPRVPCTAGQAAAIDAYRAAAQNVPRPDRWVVEPLAFITVTNVEYLGRNSPDDDFEWDAGFCFEGSGYTDSPLYTQRVTIEAQSPGGRIVRTLQMVKNEG